jgi:long-chain acyl-CoA synthetase
LAYLVEDANPVAVLTTRAGVNTLTEALNSASCRPALVAVEAADSCTVLHAGAAVSKARSTHEDPPLLRLYTSGSTGKPKAVVRTHTQLLGEVATLQTMFEVHSGDRFLGAAPFFHVNGLVRTMLTGTLAGATLFPIVRFLRRPVMELIASERITYFGGVPQMFGLLAQMPGARGSELSSLRVVFSSSAPLPSDDNARFHAAHGMFVRQLYGSTETGTISHNASVNIEETLDSVGTPLPGVQVSVVDEQGAAQGTGAEGELVVASPFAASSYDGDAEATAKSFQPFGYRSGDLGRMDDAGHLWLTGRKTLVINRAGFKVNPYEVEQVVRQHPKVAEALVVGEPASHGGQTVRCLVVGREECTADEILVHCRSRLAEYKIPGLIEFRDELPRTSSGKLVRHGSP